MKRREKVSNEEGINQAIEWKEQYQEEQKRRKKKEKQGNAQL